MVRDPCQLQSGQRQTAWLTHGPCPAKDTLSPACAMQDKDSMFQVGITALKFKVATPGLWELLLQAIPLLVSGGPRPT